MSGALDVEFDGPPGQRRLVKLTVADPGGITTDTLRGIKPNRLQAAENLGTRGELALLRPDGTAPEVFYERVAAAYRTAAVDSNRPAVTIAEASGVPVDTARSWIREARRRGFLPTGRKGQTG